MSRGELAIGCYGCKSGSQGVIVRFASFAIGAALLVTTPGAAHAVLLRGDAEVVSRTGTWYDAFGNGTLPFGLEADSLEGVHASILFWIDTDLLPPDSHPAPSAASYGTSGSDPEWLRMEIELNGFVREIGYGERGVDALEGSPPENANGDYLRFVAARSATFPNGTTYPAEVLGLTINVDDFGDGALIPTDLDLTELIQIWGGTTYFLRHDEFDPISGAATTAHWVSLDFDVLSFHLHPVPEPNALTGVAVVALLLIRRAQARGASR